MPTINKYGVEISIDVQSWPRCCGAHIINRFAAQGAHHASSFTKEQKIKMYKTLLRDVLRNVSGQIVAADAVIGEGGGGRDGGGVGTSWAASAGDGAGDVSLEDFCREMGFEETSLSINSNSGNAIGVFTLASRPIEDGGDRIDIPEQDFSDDAAPEPQAQGGDLTREEVIALIAERLRSAS